VSYFVKRYSNRKLYDTQESRYVTLEDLEELIRNGKEISVVDAASGEDLTAVTLTQIILENERNHRPTLPSAFLHQLIKHGQAWQEFLAKAMNASVESLVSGQREMDRMLREWTTRTGWAGTPLRAEPRRDGSEPDADKLRAEVATLRERLHTLEERLERRKSESR